jgi:hypothetical protein
MTSKRDSQALAQATRLTAADLRSVATTVRLRQLSKLSLPEIEHLSDEIARVVPAGNAPAMILSGLANIRSRTVDVTESRRHIGLLSRGLRHTLDEAVYATFFAGPAAVLYSYQLLLQLAGKDADAAFPNGVWQFYLEMGLREDTARHANETTGFHRALRQQKTPPEQAEQLAAWLLAVRQFILDQEDLLANEWHEFTTLRLLRDAAAEANINPTQYDRLFGQWTTQRPYATGKNARRGETFPAYRRRMFDEFTRQWINALPRAARRSFEEALAAAQESDLPAYQAQFSWLAYLEPGQYSEARQPYNHSHAMIGVIWQERYYLLPLYGLTDTTTVRAQAKAILNDQPANPPAALDRVLVRARRTEQPTLRDQLDATSRAELDRLRYAPVIINWDLQPDTQPRKPLALLRADAQRGIGDHPLTILRTADSIIFDQSHIFFDGAWGSAAAEVLTNSAAALIGELARAPRPSAWPQPLDSPALQIPPKVAEAAGKARCGHEASAESDAIKLAPILELRNLLKQRSDLAQVTVNDLFVLYRGLHASRYEPSADLKDALKPLARARSAVAKQAYKLVQEAFDVMQGKNPAILIPVDARPHNPRERVFPTTFRNPFTDFWQQHRRTYDALKAYETAAKTDPGVTFQQFYEAQLYYLRLIGGFGELLSRYKDVARAGQSTSMATIKLLGHLPPALQKMLDSLPNRLDVLNEVIKGEEVFSNVGRVAAGSSLRRFITAKDDNDQKTLMWGVITNDDGTVRLSLRDFRPHVQALHAAGMSDLAQRITQDYVDAFASGLNTYIAELTAITTASRATAAIQAPQPAAPVSEAAIPAPAPQKQTAPHRKRRPLVGLIALVILVAGLGGALLLTGNLPQVTTLADSLLSGAEPTSAPGYWLPIHFTYDADGFYWHSDTGNRIQPVANITFEQIGGASVFEGIRWNRIYSTLEPHNCMALTFINEDHPLPPDCQRPNALMQLSRSGPFIFWRGTEQFRVLWDNVPIAVCESAAGTCTASVPPP